MAISVTSRPASWAPILNPVVYKMSTSGGPFTNYRIAVEVFRSSDNASITGGVKFNFTPNPSGVTTINVAALIKNYLRRELVPVTSGVNQQEDQIGSFKFYIKYQELYTGSATSVVSDSANARIGVISARQIISNADLIPYIIGDVDKKFLYNRVKLRVWRNYPFTVSFLYPDGIDRIYRYFAPNVGAITSDILDENTFVDKLNKLRLPAIDPIATTANLQLVYSSDVEYNEIDVVPNNEFTSNMVPWSNNDIGSDWVWASDGGEGTIKVHLPIPLDATYKSKIVAVKLTEVLNGVHSIGLNYKSDAYVIIQLYTKGLGSSDFVEVAYMQFDYTTYTDVVSVASNFLNVEYIGIRFINDSSYGGGGPGEGVDPIDVDVYVSKVVVNEATYIIDPASESKELVITDACKNPVYLFWKNRLGGDCYWMFDYNQEYAFTYADGRKAKRVTLFANKVSIDEWEELNDLNTPGEVFIPNIPELTASVIKTAVKSDQQVYELKQDGTKIGVIVITRSNSYSSKNNKASFEIEIEYPDYYL